MDGVGPKIEYLQQCWKQAKNHWVATIIAALSFVYSALTNWVALPSAMRLDRWPKLPIPWAIAICAGAGFWIALVGGYHLKKLQEQEFQTDLAAEKRRTAKAVADLNDSAPKMSLEYSAENATNFHGQLSGLMIRNGGKRDGFRVAIVCETTSDAGVRLTFEDMPIQRVGPDKPAYVTVRGEYKSDEDQWYPMGGTPGMQIEDFFEALHRTTGQTMVSATLSYVDYDGNEYATTWAIKSEGIFLVTKRIWCEPSRASDCPHI